MRTRRYLAGALACIALLPAACSRESGSAAPAPAETPQPASLPTATPAPAPAPQATESTAAPPPEVAAADAVPAPATPAQVPAIAASQSSAAPSTQPAAPPAARPAVPEKPPVPAAVPVPTPVPTPSAAPPAVAAGPAPGAPADMADPGGVVAVAATKPGLERIGSEACGDCHDVQFTSWSEGPHASRKPPLDCENCHGPGSEYEAKSVMKDPDKAAAAGLVMPDKAFCAKCHKKGVNDELMKRVHAHEG